MDISSLGIVSVGAITVVCYLVGAIVKASGLNNRWIPIICAGCGLVLGLVAMHTMPDFPATDYLTAAAIGTVSGWAATGVDQTGKQLTEK